MQKHSSIKQPPYIKATTASFIQMWTAVINNSSVATNHYLVHNKVSLPREIASEIELPAYQEAISSAALKPLFTRVPYTLNVYGREIQRWIEQGALQMELVRLCFSTWEIQPTMCSTSDGVARTGLLWERGARWMRSYLVKNDEWICYLLDFQFPARENEYRVDDREIWK